MSNNIQSSRFKKTSLAGSSALLLALALLALLLATSEKQVQAADKRPVSLGDNEFNFGNLPQSVLVKHCFWIHSTSTETLEIDTVVTGCGCTSVPMSSITLNPGDSLPFEINFDTKSFRGAVVKKPWFKLKGDTTIYGFKFYAQVAVASSDYYPLRGFPYVLDVSQADTANHQVKFTLENLSDEDVTVSVADFPVIASKIDFPETILAGEKVSASLTVIPSYFDSVVATSVTFEVNHSQLYRLTLPILRSGFKPSAVDGGQNESSSPTETRTSKVKRRKDK